MSSVDTTAGEDRRGATAVLGAAAGLGLLSTYLAYFGGDPLGSEPLFAYSAVGGYAVAGAIAVALWRRPPPRLPIGWAKGAGVAALVAAVSAALNHLVRGGSRPPIVLALLAGAAVVGAVDRLADLRQRTRHRA